MVTKMEKKFYITGEQIYFWCQEQDYYGILKFM